MADEAAVAARALSASDGDLAAIDARAAAGDGMEILNL